MITNNTHSVSFYHYLQRSSRTVCGTIEEEGKNGESLSTSISISDAILHTNLLFIQRAWD